MKIQRTLGPRYFPFILSELRGTLKRGYQKHVLCFTVHQLLKNMESVVRPGDIDICLKSLQEVCKQFYSNKIRSLTDDHLPDTAVGSSLSCDKVFKLAKGKSMVLPRCLL